MAPIILRQNPSPDDTAWMFTESLPQIRQQGFGRHISFKPEKISVDVIRFPQNRILQSDDLSKFILVSFEGLRFPGQPARVAREYMIRFFKEGLFLNGVQYRFYGHSNSQLRSRSCFLREASSDQELDARIYQFGDFERIASAAKRAKRIGLLFSEAKLDWILDPQHTANVDDIENNGENFSDGCGLISTQFSQQLSRRKRIIYHGRPYTPAVYQISADHFQGVLMLDPKLTKAHVHFRKSQRKFNATQNNTFSVVDYSTPFAFGRLNNDIVVLLSSLGISNETFLAKQQAYHEWVEGASEHWETAFDFLCALNKYEVAERLLLDGLESAAVRREIRALQNSELAGLRKNDRLRVRTILPKSRLLFGVCDPYGVLREGEVHVRVSLPRQGAATLTNVDVLIVRNPCLYPGDCLKLRAVAHPALAHLVDCLVFATRGKRAAPSMSSGGDLDGDKFTVIWDPDIVPRKVAESYDYPAPPERPNASVTRQDLAKHFASYNSMTMGRLSALHQKWVRYSPKGAMCSECQELNALYSLSVDGGSVRIPERLEKVPERQGGPPYVLDELHQAAEAFAQRFQLISLDGVEQLPVDSEVAREMVTRLLATETAAISEYEAVMKACALAQKHGIDMHPFLTHINFAALKTAEKFALCTMLGLEPDEHPYMWNSLVRSEILRPRDLEDRDLGGSLHLQRLYSSTIQGRAAFFEYLRDALQNYRRRVIILKAEDRFSTGIFIRGEVKWNDDHCIDDNVLVCSFMPQTTATLCTYKRGVLGWKLYCNDSIMQLFNRHRVDSFIFVSRAAEKSGTDIINSIALQKLSSYVQRQMGRINRAPVVTLEIHVVSNRDKVAHQAFDLRFDFVETEEYLPRFDHRPEPYTPNAVLDVDWTTRSADMKAVFTEEEASAMQLLVRLSIDDLLDMLRFARYYRAEDRIFWIFKALMQAHDPPLSIIAECLEEHPPLAYVVLRQFLDNDASHLGDAARVRIASAVTREIIRSANELGIAALVALEKLASDVARLELPLYCDLLWLACHTIRSSQLLQEILLVLHDGRVAQQKSRLQEYVLKHALGIVFDRAEDAADACPCDDAGRPKRQRIAPIAAKLRLVGEEGVAQPESLIPSQVMADVRVDISTPIRIHSHVRLVLSSPAEHSTLPAAVLDAVVLRASRGELMLDLQQPLPPEYMQVNWRIYNAGSVATSKAMLDALQRFAIEGMECCRFNDVIIGDSKGLDEPEHLPTEDEENLKSIPASLNPSQRDAVISAKLGRMSLIWGPPGTGKTTVVVQILLRFLRQDTEARLLMTASTHNAVDNVLERFVAENARDQVLSNDQILRAATESSRVNKALQKYTIDARLGGSLNEDPRLLRRAEKRVKEARIVFTTCTGAGLGIIRKANFEIVLIDEASQITEPAAMIPLVKGCHTAVMVGDHVQLRPTVRPMGKALEFDRSLFERLYTGPHYRTLSRTMLRVSNFIVIQHKQQLTAVQTQYRFSEAVAKFPSTEFYEGRLETGSQLDAAIASLALTSFPWPTDDPEQNLFPVVFVPCTSEEDYGRSSKSNKGQVNLVKHILHLLRTPAETDQESPEGSVSAQEVSKQLHELSIAILTPYSRQVKLLTENIKINDQTVVSTIDGFQGREADIVVFTTVRSNIDGDLGFLDDARRLNVAWTRPKLALIVVGDKRTLGTNGLWKRAIEACKEVVIERPVEAIVG
ncbi:RNA dependent RNA polymerase-domain-containing protein [Cytidiella melzeri]|nr:RNA dependent RNA polymerase-domain-containing protein [Cytidiella melzeri]